MQKPNTKRLATISMLAAISVILVTLIHFPIFPAVSFLAYDPADVPIFIGTFAFGPFWGIALTAIVSIIQGVTVSAGDGLVGALMHILATGSFSLVAGLVYRRHKTRRRAVLALCCGTVTMVAIMVLWNLIVTPWYLGVPTSVVTGLLPWIILFNLIKAGGNSLLTFLLYKPTHGLIEKIEK